MGKKRRGGGDYPQSKRRKFGQQQAQAMEVDPLFPKLDQSNPVYAKRIQQRRKEIQKGKNTPGYFEYTKQVPKHERKPRSMDTPSTPDHTLDIPTKRWQGMVKAW